MQQHWQRATATVTSVTQDDAPAEDLSFHQELKKRFIEGGPGFMGIVLLCLILGLAIAIERIIFLNLSTTNTKKLTQNVEDALASGGIEAAKEVCRNTKGPVASIFYQGLRQSR
jgi:biopolymer transport protein ExbB